MPRCEESLREARPPSRCGGPGCFVSGIQRAADRHAAAIEDVSIDHSRPDVFVTRQCLDGADLVVVFRYMRGKGLAEGMGRDSSGDASLFDGLLHSILVHRSPCHPNLWKSGFSQGARV